MAAFGLTGPASAAAGGPPPARPSTRTRGPPPAPTAPGSSTAASPCSGPSRGDGRVSKWSGNLTASPPSYPSGPHTLEAEGGGGGGLTPGPGEGADEGRDAVQRQRRRGQGGHRGEVQPRLQQPTGCPAPPDARERGWQQKGGAGRGRARYSSRRRAGQSRSLAPARHPQRGAAASRDSIRAEARLVPRRMPRFAGGRAREGRRLTIYHPPPPGPTKLTYRILGEGKPALQYDGGKKKCRNGAGCPALLA